MIAACIVVLLWAFIIFAYRARCIAVLVWALVFFGLGFLPGRDHTTEAHLFGLWGWALTVAFGSSAIAVLAYLTYWFLSSAERDVADSPGVSRTRYNSPEASHGDTLFALHTLGGTRLVWDAYPVDDGSLEIGSLHLEDKTGKPVRFGWAARCCEDDAYALANRYSAVPGHYVLALPSGTVISAPSHRPAARPEPTPPQAPLRR
jgi:hypothetical protein